MSAAVLPDQVYSDDKILEIAKEHPEGIAEWVEANAQRKGISLPNTRYYKLASAISRLSDSETELDHTEKLLVAMSRARLITDSQLGILQVSYLRHSARQRRVAVPDTFHALKMNGCPVSRF